MKNAIISLILTIILCACIFPSFVSSASESETELDTTLNATEETTEETTEDITEDADTTPAPDEADPIEESEATTFGETLVGWLEDHIDKIFAAAAATGSAILFYAFKKGLLPVVASFVDRSSKAVAEIKESTDEKISDFFDRAAPLLDGVDKYAEAFKSAIHLVDQSHNEREALIVAIREQSALTLAMIEGSRLPESVKEKARLSAINTEKVIARLAEAQESPEEAANEAKEG